MVLYLFGSRQCDRKSMGVIKSYFTYFNFDLYLYMVKFQWVVQILPHSLTIPVYILFFSIYLWVTFSFLTIVMIFFLKISTIQIILILFVYFIYGWNYAFTASSHKKHCNYFFKLISSILVSSFSFFYASHLLFLAGPILNSTFQ